MNWLYKATNTKLDPTGTMILADKRGFLCRSAYDSARTWADNVRKVAFGDGVHFYFVARSGRVNEIGLFEVVRRDQHSTPDFFGEIVPGTALYVVENPEFVEKLDPKRAYRPDPVLGKLTGWLLRKVDRAMKYDGSLFPGQGTLVPLKQTA